MEPTFSHNEMSLNTMSLINWNTHYLTSKGQLKERCCCGAFLGRICRWLKLDTFSFIKNLFRTNFATASELIKVTMSVIRDDQESKLAPLAKRALIEKTINAFNDRMAHINTRRAEGDRLPESILINIKDIFPEAGEQKTGEVTNSSTSSSSSNSSKPRVYLDPALLSPPANGANNGSGSNRSRSMVASAAAAAPAAPGGPLGSGILGFLAESGAEKPESKAAKGKGRKKGRSTAKPKAKTKVAENGNGTQHKSNGVERRSSKRIATKNSLAT